MNFANFSFLFPAFAVSIGEEESGKKFLGFEGKLKGNLRVQFRVQTEEKIQARNLCGEFQFFKGKTVGLWLKKISV